MDARHTIAKLLNTQVPETLWHYTSVRGFYGIVTTKTIWATDIHFLSDRKEFVHAREIAREVIAETPQYGSHFFPAQEYMEKSVSLAFDVGLLSQDRLQVFVASFSAAEDQLSQWRGYSQGSCGVSLGFQLSALRPPAEVGTLVCFAPCVYKLGEKKALLRDALTHFTKETQDYWSAAFDEFIKYEGPRPLAKNPAAVQEIIDKIQTEANFTNRLESAVVKTQADILRVAALSKDESFHEEQEWRLVLPVSAEKEKLQNPTRFRAEKTTLIPYIAYPLPPSAGTLPLVDLILGPGSHEAANLAARALLKSEGIGVTPWESKVPYRPW